MSCRRRSFPKGCAGFPHSLTVAEPLRSDTTTRSTTRKSRCLRRRSEEHTSELQSLMRISYAVFCLKKKKSQEKHYMYNETMQNNTNNTTIKKNNPQL